MKCQWGNITTGNNPTQCNRGAKGDKIIIAEWKVILKMYTVTLPTEQELKH